MELLGATKLRARLVRLAKAMTPTSKKTVTEVATLIRDGARRDVDKDTESLMKSIRRETLKFKHPFIFMVSVRAGGYIINPKTGRPVDYAIWVEIRNPYLLPNVIYYREMLPKLMLKGMKESK